MHRYYCAARLVTTLGLSLFSVGLNADPAFTDDHWIHMNVIPGADDEVYCSAVDASGNLYIGGWFIAVGGAAAHGVAKWDGSSWSALGPGFNGPIFALATSGTTVYAAGDGFVAKWEGSKWSLLGSGMNDLVAALAVSGTDLYAAGYFTWCTNADGVQANRIAKWDGSSWSALDSGLDGHVETIAMSGSDLYVGGAFTTAGGVVVSNIAKWDGSSWSALGSGMNGYAVYALAVSGSDVYAGGTFTTAGGVSAIYIAKWDGSSWNALHYGLDGYPFALATSGKDLYAGGGFIAAGGVVATNIAKWNGSTWSVVGSSAGALATGFDVTPRVNTLAASGSNIYIGGAFTTVDGVLAFAVAKWNGKSWSALGPGLGGPAQFLAASGTNVYAGGLIKWSVYSGPPYFAKWNGGTDWSLLLSGVDVVPAMFGTNLYVSGSFTNIGHVPANHIAKWDGTTWSALGSGVNDVVAAFAMSGSNLYVAGAFTNAGDGVAANYIAKWDGSSWSALGSGLGDFPRALVVSGTNLYAAGGFTNAGGVQANRIAKWDGSSWSALGSGLTDPYDIYTIGWVSGLAVAGSDLYAAGNFTTAGGVGATNIAKWDGTSWSPLGSGLGNGTVGGYALAASETGSDLYVAGDFMLAGGKPSPSVARAILHLPSLTLNQTTSSTAAVSWPSPSTGFVLQQNTDGLNPLNWTNVTDSIVDDGTNKVVTQPIGMNRFFRLVLP